MIKLKSVNFELYYIIIIAVFKIVILKNFR